MLLTQRAYTCSLVFHLRRADFPLFLAPFFLRLPLLPLVLLGSIAGGSVPAKTNPPGITREVRCATPLYKTRSSTAYAWCEVHCLLPSERHMSFSHRCRARCPLSRELHLPRHLTAFTRARFLDTMVDLGCSTPNAELVQGCATWWRRNNRLKLFRY